MNRTMLRFRPIAPKPATGESGSGSPLPEKKCAVVTKGRAKRKYVRDKKNSGCKRNKVERAKKDGSDANHDFPAVQPVQQQQPIWLNFDMNQENTTKIDFSLSDLTAVAPPQMVAESWVTVECITDACMDAGVSGLDLGCTDVERIKNLEVDACPGFISDGLNRVQLVNQEYRKMVAAAEELPGGPPPQTVVRLAANAELPVECPAFACRVRVQYKWRKETCSRTMPCDVWRMDSGGFAWRLDVKAALSLGR